MYLKIALGVFYIIHLQLIFNNRFNNLINDWIILQNVSIGWTVITRNQKVTARSSCSFFTNFVLRHSWNDWIILQNES